MNCRVKSHNIMQVNNKDGLNLFNMKWYINRNQTGGCNVKVE